LALGSGKILNMEDLIKVLARIELLAGKDVRQVPFISGYRPAFYFEGERTRISGRIDLTDRDSFMPGTSGLVNIAFIKGMIDDSRFNPNEEFTFSEGRNVLGKGIIIERLNQK